MATALTTPTTPATLRWTSADLEVMPDDGKRREIIDGELFVSKQPHAEHQFTCAQVTTFLQVWSMESDRGATFVAPGLIFDDDEDVAPDVVWCSRERLPSAIGPDGKFHAAPDLVVEVLSPGLQNARRDREAKLKLYSRRGVREYWIVDWQLRQVELYRREAATLRLVATLLAGDTLESPLLPGFACPVRRLFAFW